MPRVYLSFFVRGGPPRPRGQPPAASEWVCNFLEADLQTLIGRIRTYSSADIVRGLIERGRGFPDLAARQAIEAALRTGRGGTYLQLTDTQYARLKR